MCHAQTHRFLNTKGNIFMITTYSHTKKTFSTIKITVVYSRLIGGAELSRGVVVNRPFYYELRNNNAILFNGVYFEPAV